jgi:hypothetical protein
MTTSQDKTPGAAMENPTRKNSPPIKVYCLPGERLQIEANARAAGLSLSTYLLKVGIGYRIRGILDHQRVDELARINGDLGRLGGLIKLWLQDDARTKILGDALLGQAALRAALARIEDTQDRMVEVMRTVVLPKDKS